MKSMKENRFCVESDPVPLTARQLADALGIKWDTVRQRRYRGWPWSEAINPKLRKTTFNDYHDAKG